MSTQTEIIVGGKALERSDFPSIGRDVPIVIWERECWTSHCDQRMTLWFVDGNGLWSRNRIEAHPDIIAAVRRMTSGEGIERSSESAPLAVLEEVVTKPAGLYLGFCCPACGMVQGDFFNMKEMISLAKRGLTTVTRT